MTETNIENPKTADGAAASGKKSRARQGAEASGPETASSEPQQLPSKKRKQARKAALPVLKGLASGERRTTRLSGETMALIGARTAAHGASPSDAAFMAAMVAMGRKRHQLPAVATGADVDLQLPPAVWEFLDAQVKATKSDFDTLIRSYLGLT